jgi:protein-arginine kinase
MGSFRHPKFYDPITVERVRDAFHEIMDDLNEHYLIRVGDSQQRLKAALIERLLALAADGTPEREWKFKILSNLPLR